MKKLATLFLAMMAMANVWAQADEMKDLIYTSEGKTVEAKVIEVSSQEIRYKDWNNQMGPTFVLTAGEVKKVEFSNGTVKTFSAAAPTAQTVPVASSQDAQPAAKASKGKMPVGFQFNIDVDGNLAFVNGGLINGLKDLKAIDRDFAVGGVNLTLGAGVRVAEWLYAGVAAGVLGEWGNPEVEYKGEKGKANFATYTVPIYGDFRAYAPTHGNCFPYVEVGIGGYVSLDGSIKFNDDKLGNLSSSNEYEKGGFYFLSGVGLEFKYLNVGAGYKLMRNNNFTGNHGYVKIGISLGRPQKLRQAGGK